MVEPRKTRLVAETMEKCPGQVGEGFDPGKAQTVVCRLYRKTDRSLRKGGIGKSTLASNFSVALSEMGFKIMQVGCSPKSDSVIFLNGGNPLETTILDYYREKGINEDTIQDTIAEGHKGVLIAEAGGPEPVYGGRENDLWMGRH
jgi:hypothetical protein